MRYPILVTLATALAASLTGCASTTSDVNELKAEAVTPAPDAGFIEHPERQTQRADLPFQKVWVEPGVDFKQYRELIVAPVNTQHMLKMDWLHKMSSAEWLGNVKADIKELAKYFRDQVVKDFQRDPHHRFQVVNEPGKRRQPTLRMELALIEIDPSQPVLHALSWAGPPGTGTAAGAVNQRRAAFEGRLRDMRTGEVIATFADRDMPDGRRSVGGACRQDTHLPGARPARRGWRQSRPGPDRQGLDGSERQDAREDVRRRVVRQPQAGAKRQTAVRR